MPYYIYYLKGAKPDIAIVESNSKEQAIEQLKLYYSNVPFDSVTQIDCHRPGYVDGIMIISEY